MADETNPTIKHASSSDYAVAAAYRERGYTAAEVEILLKLSRLEGAVTELKEARFVRREEFEPIQRLVYGLVGLILVAVVGALLALVVMK